MSDDTFDVLLRESLQTRPVPAPAQDIAAAGLLVAVALWAIFFSGNSNDSTTQDETRASRASQVTESTDTGSYAAAVLGVAAVGLVTNSLLSGDRTEPLGTASPVA